MVSKQAQKRLNKEYSTILKSPIPFIITKPLESNILEWHFVITGAPDTPYHNGQYHGKVIFPSDYPFSPPAIKMITPSGRFEPNTSICLSMSEYHKETWNPAWSVATILTGLMSFMNDNEMTTGSIRTTDEEKRELASSSKEWNRKQPVFQKVFPDLLEDDKNTE